MDNEKTRKEICAIVDGLAAGQKSVCKLFYYEGDITVTYNVYVHVLASTENRAASLLEAM